MDKVAVIVQARLTSRRFPNKVLANLKGRPLLDHMIENLSKLPFEVIFAIPDTPTNDVLETWLLDHNQKVFRGTENDVLARFYQCATLNKIKTIIRVCADTPLIRPQDVIRNYSQFVDELATRMIYGNGSWVFSYEMLEDAMKNQPHAESREHVVRSMFNAIDYPDDITRVEQMMN